MNAEHESLLLIESDDEIQRRERDCLSTELSPTFPKEFSQGEFNLVPRLSCPQQEQGITQSELESPNHLTRERYKRMVKIQPKCPIKKFRREDKLPRKSRRRLAFGNGHNPLKSDQIAADTKQRHGKKKDCSKNSSSLTKENKISPVWKGLVDRQEIDALPSMQKSRSFELCAKSAGKRRSLSKPSSPVSGFLSGVSFLTRSSDDSLCASLKPLERSPNLSGSPLSAIRTSTPVNVRAQLQWEEISSLTDSGEEGSWLPLPLRRSSRFFTSSELQISSSLETFPGEEQSPKKDNSSVSVMSDSDKENQLPLLSSPPPKLVSTEKPRVPLAPLLQLRGRPNKRVRSPSIESSSESTSPNILGKVMKLHTESKGSISDEETRLIINSTDFEPDFPSSGSESPVSNKS